MSNYPAFDAMIDNDDGTFTPLASVTIDIYDVDGSASLGTTASDADGHVAGGSLAGAVGTLVRFSYHAANGICGYAEVVTT